MLRECTISQKRIECNVTTYAVAFTCAGNLTVEMEHGLRFKKAQGRVMMDATSFKQMNPDTEISYLQYDRW